MKYKSLIIFGTGFVLGWMISPFFVEMLDYIERHPFIVLAIALSGLAITTYILFVMKEKKKKRNESKVVMITAPSTGQQPRVQGNQVERFSPSRYFKEKYGSFPQDDGKWLKKGDIGKQVEL